MRLTRLGLFGFAALALLSTAAACNAILGVTDVTLQRDASGDAGDPLGDDDDGRDNPNTFDGSPPAPKPNRLQVVLGDLHTCARAPGGAVKCWGDTFHGQLGNGPDGGAFVATPEVVTAVTDAIDISAGKNHTCVVREAGTVSCWGFNFDGQLGNGELSNQHDKPVDVRGLTATVAVAAGGNFTCAARAGGTVACWGGNGSGQLGTGDYAVQATPALTKKVAGVVGVTAGEAHACALTSDGAVSCWGDGENGQLGNGTPTKSPVPVLVDQLPEIVAIAAAERSTCALAKAGSVYCWGANEVGQLGNGATSPAPNPRPVVVAGLDDGAAIAAGGNHICATRRGGSVACWGDGARGALGDGQADAGPRASLVAVSVLKTAVLVGAGGNHSCATTDDAKIYCWGANDRGQLGSGEGTVGVDMPAPVAVRGYP